MHVCPRKKNVFDLDWNNEGVKYKDVFFQAEKEFSAYNFESVSYTHLTLPTTPYV